MAAEVLVEVTTRFQRSLRRKFQAMSHCGQLRNLGQRVARRLISSVRWFCSICGSSSSCMMGSRGGLVRFKKMGLISVWARK